MRQKQEPQLEIFHTMPRTQIGQELDAMSRILDENPGMLDRVYQDLVGMRSTETGRNGMTAEQTLRCADSQTVPGAQLRGAGVSCE